MSHPLDLKQGRVEMAHGGGGRAMAQLIRELFLPFMESPALRAGNDGALLARPEGRLVVATDSHVITPLFFPGGDIGSLAVHGTLNDVAMMGARPIALSAGFILEEGLPLADLARIAQSMGEAARAAGVPIVTGDTKVVERGKGDGLYINTTGIGVVADGVELGGERARPGDHLLLSGTLGDHGIAILAQRENLAFASDIRSDSAALHGLVATMLDAAPGLRCLRDPTRGGLAAALNEIAGQSGVGALIREAAIRLRPPVRAVCELLGLDPLNIANEGKLLAISPPGESARLLAAMRAHPLGHDAALIGECIADPHHFVQMETRFGGRRTVDWLASEPLPRIC
ncbi:MAG: hydrogenase expression/formation protein HypE [Gammaproteobacteria bacterium]|nr:hydrogenase expression/formation protein HypE [Gammaproteobacteria bacterium]